jgi:hypothetical protein
MGRKTEVPPLSSQGRKLVSWRGAPAASALAIRDRAAWMFPHPLHAHHALTAAGHHH